MKFLGLIFTYLTDVSHIHLLNIRCPHPPADVSHIWGLVLKDPQFYSYIKIPLQALLQVPLVLPSKPTSSFHILALLFLPTNLLYIREMLCVAVKTRGYSNSRFASYLHYAAGKMLGAGQPHSFIYCCMKHQNYFNDEAHLWCGVKAYKA